jgi:thymidylate synthase (FAD)
LLHEPYDPLNDGNSLVEYIQHMGSDRMVVNAARVSFNSDIQKQVEPPGFSLGFDPIMDSIKKSFEVDEKDAKLIKYLADHKHSSPFQHCMVTLHIACPLFVYAQWRRHRTFNYTQINEISRRYTSEDLEFHFPSNWRGQSHLNRQGSEGAAEDQFQLSHKFEGAVEHCIDVYLWMLDMGVAREQARMVLPQNMYTRFYATVDLWNLYHFWSLRQDPHAQEEIRVYADAIDGILSELYPVAWKSLKGE